MQELDNDFSYVKGVVAGDGWITIDNKRGDYSIRLGVTDEDFAKYFAKILARWLGKVPRIQMVHREPPRKNMFYIKVRSKAAVQLVLKNDAPSIAEFLKGFYDSDGWITIDRTYARIGVAKSNIALLKEIQEFFKAQGFYAGISRYSKCGFSDKPCYKMQIGSEKGILWFAENVGFRIGRKQERLVKAVQNISQKIRRGRAR